MTYTKPECRVISIATQHLCQSSGKVNVTFGVTVDNKWDGTRIEIEL